MKALDEICMKLEEKSKKSEGSKRYRNNSEMCPKSHTMLQAPPLPLYTTYITLTKQKK
jgi:hypothetical protein